MDKSSGSLPNIKNHLNKLGIGKSSPKSSSSIYLKMTYKRKKMLHMPLLVILTTQKHYYHPEHRTVLVI